MLRLSAITSGQQNLCLLSIFTLAKYDVTSGAAVIVRNRSNIDKVSKNACNEFDIDVFSHNTDSYEAMLVFQIRRRKANSDDNPSILINRDRRLVYQRGHNSMQLTQKTVVLVMARPHVVIDYINAIPLLHFPRAFSGIASQCLQRVIREPTIAV